MPGTEHKKVYSTDKETLDRLEENRTISGLPIDFYYMGGGDQNNADRGGVVQKVSLESLKKAQESKGAVNVVAGKADLMFQAITDEQAAKFPTWNSDLLLINALLINIFILIAIFQVNCSFCKEKLILNINLKLGL